MLPLEAGGESRLVVLQSQEPLLQEMRDSELLNLCMVKKKYACYILFWTERWALLSTGSVQYPGLLRHVVLECSFDSFGLAKGQFWPFLLPTMQ